VKLLTAVYFTVIGLVCALAVVALWVMHNRITDLNP
jgi:hypothetical protein